jgi:hypothetical protein
MVFKWIVDLTAILQKKKLLIETIQMKNNKIKYFLIISIILNIILIYIAVNLYMSNVFYGKQIDYFISEIEKLQEGIMILKKKCL